MRLMNFFTLLFGLFLALPALGQSVPAPVDQTQNAGAASGGEQTATTPPSATEPSFAPLMSVLDKAGLAKSLKKAGINIYGYVEGGYMYDFTSPGFNDGPTFMGFNSFKNKAILDKVSMNIERTVDPTKKKFDLGFHAEGIYGADAAFIHSNGMSDTQTGRNQWDFLQGYVDVAFPDMPLRLRVGKWIELAGFEHFSADNVATPNYLGLPRTYRSQDKVTLGVLAFFGPRRQVVRGCRM